MRELKDEEYKKLIEEAADYLCGFSCGTSVDIVLEYVSRPDCSVHQMKRLIDELTIYFKKLYEH